MIKNLYIFTVKNFRAHYFSGQAQVAKKSCTVKKFNTAYIHLGVIRVIWASVLCNLDQSREWV